MAITLSPYDGESELGDPALAGEFADELVFMARSAQAPPWCTYIAWRDGLAVGSGGFKAPPGDDGVAEIGYLTFIPARRSAVATDLAAALIKVAKSNGLAAVRAHTLPELNPSTRVLTANGFRRVADIDDPDDGPVWRWEIDLADNFA